MDRQLMTAKKIDPQPELADLEDLEAPAAEPAEGPAPKPGEAGFDWTADYGTAELYTHTFPDGTVIALKPFGSIYSKTWLYKLRDLQTDVDIEFAALDRAASPAAKQVLAGLDDSAGDPLDDLFKAWAASATAGPGEELTPGK